jgi:hypothetical protein
LSISESRRSGLPRISSPEDWSSVMTGATPEEAVRFVFSSLAAGRLLEGQPRAVQDRAGDDLLSLFSAAHRPGQGVMMAGSAWLVTARA